MYRSQGFHFLQMRGFLNENSRNTDEVIHGTPLLWFFSNYLLFVVVASD